MSNWKDYVEDIDLTIKKLQDLRNRIVEVNDNYNGEFGLEFMIGLRYQQEPVRWCFERLGYFPKRYIDNYRIPVVKVIDCLVKNDKEKLEKELLKFLDIVPCEEKDYHPDRGQIVHSNNSKKVVPPSKKWKG